MPGYTLHDGITVKNLLGATSHEELERLQVELVEIRTLELELSSKSFGNFDAAHLKSIHRHLFQDVFEWAGRTRDEKVLLSDGTVATEPSLRKIRGSEPFLPGPFIPKGLDLISGELREADYLRNVSRIEFASRAADLMANINAVHAFREGNGRTQRAFLRQLAKQAGHELDFRVVSRQRMIRASIAANERDDPSMMRRLFDEITTPSRIAALGPAIEHLGQRNNFYWNGVYLATAEPGHPIDVTVAGFAAENFMGVTASGEIIIGQRRDLPAGHAEGDACHLRPSRWPKPASRLPTPPEIDAPYPDWTQGFARGKESGQASEAYPDWTQEVGRRRPPREEAPPARTPGPSPRRPRK